MKRKSRNSKLTGQDLGTNSEISPNSTKRSRITVSYFKSISPYLGIFFGLSSEKKELIIKYVKRLKNDDPTLPVTEKSKKLQEENKKLRVQVE